VKFDVIFLSYDEPYADEHWERLKEKFPKAQRVHGIKGILEAHKECARVARTDYFFVVDGDAYILDSFGFDNVPFEISDDRFYMWMSRNAVNDLQYGNGGVKLFPKGIFDGIKEYGIDLFIHLPHERIRQVVSVSRFNCSPFCSWRAGFRECAQLASQHSKRPRESTRRNLLKVWCSKGAERPFGGWCIQGSRAGRKYGLENIGNEKAVEMINNFDWLRERFYHELKEGYLKGMDSELNENQRP